MEKRKNGIPYQELLQELRYYQAKGVILKLDGVVVPPEIIASACCVAERGSYMRDYVGDIRGNITELGFDCVGNEYQKGEKEK